MVLPLAIVAAQLVGGKFVIDLNELSSSSS
jgi:hypothetical protein